MEWSELQIFHKREKNPLKMRRTLPVSSLTCLVYLIIINFYRLRAVMTACQNAPVCTGLTSLKIVGHMFSGSDIIKSYK